MRIAVASQDGTDVSPHFGRSRCFIVYDVDDGRLVGKQTRQNAHTSYAKGECGGEEHRDETHHNHADIRDLLKDCDAVVSRGMSWRVAKKLQASGVRPVVSRKAFQPTMP